MFVTASCPHHSWVLSPRESNFFPEQRDVRAAVCPRPLLPAPLRVSVAGSRHLPVGCCGYFSVQRTGVISYQLESYFLRDFQGTKRG